MRSNLGISLLKAVRLYFGGAGGKCLAMFFLMGFAGKKSSSIMLSVLLFLKPVKSSSVEPFSWRSSVALMIPVFLPKIFLMPFRDGLK